MLADRHRDEPADEDTGLQATTCDISSGDARTGICCSICYPDVTEHSVLSHSLSYFAVVEQYLLSDACTFNICTLNIYHYKSSMPIFSVVYFGCPLSSCACWGFFNTRTYREKPLKLQPKQTVAKSEGRGRRNRTMTNSDGDDDDCKMYKIENVMKTAGRLRPTVPTRPIGKLNGLKNRRCTHSLGKSIALRKGYKFSTDLQTFIDLNFTVGEAKFETNVFFTVLSSPFASHRLSSPRRLWVGRSSSWDCHLRTHKVNVLCLSYSYRRTNEILAARRLGSMRPFSDPKTNNKDKGTYDTAFHTLSIEVSTPEGCLNSDVQKSRKEKLQNDAYLGKLKSKAEWEGHGKLLRCLAIGKEHPQLPNPVKTQPERTFLLPTMLPATKLPWVTWMMMMMMMMLAPPPQHRPLFSTHL
uniref:HDC10046 n=1 Tax=Drosophila melanogaster TaxID=7227 RepID=Q6IL83_DROME|nr:TPA_inf: HDC10046 [Drosophila melanogaster]